MIFRYPVYYDSFHCIADRCEDTCCAGWEIDIDDESYDYYMSVPGEFGERLRKSIREYKSEDEDAYESHGFILKEDKRCPFLNEQGLCDMYRELGEGALCDVCTNTPRNILEYGRERELAISASCPEAGRLIYGSEKPIAVIEREIDEELDFEETDEEVEFAHAIREARDSAIRILQNRSYSILERASVFLKYAEKIQDCLNSNDVPGMAAVEPNWESIGVPLTDPIKRHELFLKRMLTFTALESIREDWNEMLIALQTHYVTPENGADVYNSDYESWMNAVKSEHREYEYEHLLVYYAFMCLARCVDDYDFIGKAKLCVVSFLMVRDMDMVWYHTNHFYRKEDRLLITRIYAKEVEHSEENLDYLSDEFLFEDTYQVEKLLLSL